MNNHDVNKIHRILIAKRKKYKLLSLIFRQKYLVVDFMSLEKIPVEYCLERKYVERSPKVISYLPKNMDEPAQEVEHEQVGISIYCLKNVAVPGNSSFFLTRDSNKIYYEKIDDDRSIYLYDDKSIQFHSDFLAKIKNLPLKKYTENAIYLGGTFTTNYYHFLIDILSKVEFLNVIPNYKNLTIVLDISIQENKNLKNLAEFFLKDFDKVYIDNSHYHQFNKLWYISAINPTIPNVVEGTKFEASFTKISPDSISYLRKICLHNFDLKQVNVKSVSKVFIARRSVYRKYNELELLEISKKHGFEPIYFEDLNIHEQIFIMRNADYIIGSSGAAWTNLLFTKENSKGLMWLGTVWGDFSVFSTLAKLVDFTLYTMRYNSQSSSFHEDYVLNTDVFENNLIQLLQE